MKNRVWMKVSADDLELPLIVAESARELAEKMGITEDHVRHCVFRPGSKFKIIVVNTEEVEDGENNI